MKIRHSRCPELFDIFILSDTTDPDIWIAEEAAFLALRERTPAASASSIAAAARTSARRATSPNGCRRFGGAYDHMIVLDADSLMTGDTHRPARRRDGAASRVGLIQTLPSWSMRRTLFARLQQFAGGFTAR